MRKIFTLIVILSICLSLSAIDTSVSLGYQERYTNTFTHSPYYISIDLWQDFSDLKIYGNYTNEFKDTDSWTFAPTQDYFTVGVSYDFGAIKLSAEHMCQHPVMSNWVVNGIQGGYTKLEVTIH